MNRIPGVRRPVLVALVIALAMPALPAMAQSADANTDARLRKIEAEVSALQRQVFPGGDGKYFAPLVQPSQPGAAQPGTPASTPVADLLTRMDTVEAQIARLTAQSEETANKLSLLEARVNAVAPPPAAAPAAASPAGSDTPATPAATNGAIISSNLAAMTAGASAAKPAAATPAAAAKPAATTSANAAKPAVGTAKPAAPSAKRLAAVKAIEKPQTDDPGDDEYSYGYRLWDAKFYPEAEQQLKLYLQKYPKHARVSFARNLLGRAYLDDGNPREAASWFLQNYQADKKGDRAPDSLLLLAEAMRQLKDTNRACVALAQFSDDYPREAAGRLKTQYDATRAGVKCN